MEVASGGMDKSEEVQEIKNDEAEQQVDRETSREIYSALRTRELKVPKYRCASPQLHRRRYLVDWLSVESKKLNLCNRVLHISIKYLDLIMDKFVFPKETNLRLLALCCLWIAAKLEVDRDIHSAVNLKNIVQDKYTYDKALQMELIIMQCLDWRLIVPTAEQFMGHYTDASLCVTDLHDGHAVAICWSTAWSYLAKYMSYFLEVSLQDYMVCTFYPSLVAASVIAASRMCLKITPTWMPLLVQKTGYDYGDLEACVQLLMNIYNEDRFRV